MNLAARLEAAASPGQILIAYETYAHVKDHIHCEDRGEIKVKGIAYPVATYQVVDSYDKLGDDPPPAPARLKLDLDLEAMSAEERDRAARALRRALATLSDPGRGIGPTDPEAKG